MSWTKRQLIDAAFEEIGIASYTYDIQPEEYQTGLNRLNSMMAKWDADGIRVGFPFMGTDLSENTNMSELYNEAVYTNLALKIAPTFGKIPTRELKVTAKQSLQTLENRTRTVLKKILPSTLHVGAGNKSRSYFPEPTEQIAVGPDSYLEF